jgi:branched-chain amino acid transport system substrate-binding protein
MKLRNLALAACLAGVQQQGPLPRPKSSSFQACPTAQAPTRPTVSHGPTAMPTTSSSVNARGGINGVKIVYEECETGYDTARGVECYERLKGKHGGATVFQPLSTGITFALTEKAPGDKISH